ncbi:hypothetical protein DFQ30_011035 [Apophysomyces sp. BC1015]|nr:hypothetical protein DFQ30_011035 [Apophysomyces sp. BC1015]
MQLLFLGLVFLVRSNAEFAKSIYDCPPLEPRLTPPTNVRDLRPDDIKVVGGMGDSVMAGFAAKGIQGFSVFDIRTFFEDRGASFGAGGGKELITVPNLMQRYSPNITGASVGEHLVEYCGGNPFYGSTKTNGKLRGVLHAVSIFDKDQLNVAQSGALAKNLDYEVDLFLAAIKLYPNINIATDWKLINILIGYLDICGSCKTEFYNIHNPDTYEAFVDNALKRIREKIPRVLVNLIGLFNVAEVIDLTAHQKYCEPIPFSTFQANQVICTCADNEETSQSMSYAMTEYNNRLHKISKKYNALNDASFAVIYTPSPINVTSFPLDAFSNIDCLHPSVKGQQWAAKATWRSIFLPPDEKPNIADWDRYDTVYCPTECDRFYVD